MGGTIKDPIAVVPHQGMVEWTKDTLTVHAPPDAALVQIWCQVIGDGQAWFDDVSWGEKGAGSGTVWIVGGVVLVVLVAGGFLILRRRRV